MKVGVITDETRNIRRIKITRTKIGRAKSGRTTVKEKSKMDEEEKRRNAENGVE
jgi:hypothetical protein